MTTKYKWDKNKHSVYALHYHLIICVKYRRKAFVYKEVVNKLKEMTINISEKFGVQITNQEVDKDHIHILFKCKPQTDLIKYINSLKGATSRVLRNEFPKLKSILWGDSFWSDSYCLITTGQVTLDQVKKYIESQGENENI
ncbi:MAG: IS200/IS605 family transposase [bacterium]